MRAIPANVVEGAPATPHRVAVVVYEGLSMLEFAAACDVFGPEATGDDEPPARLWYELIICAATSTVRTEHGLTMQVPRRLAALRCADTIVMTPCTDPTTVPDAVLDAVRRAHARGARVLSLCTGAWVLARTGLLDGRRAVTHWADCDAFAAAHPEVTLDPAVLYVDDGDVLTSAGSAASIDLCLHVVRKDHGAELAARIARRLVVPPHRDGGQAQYIEAPMPGRDGGTARLGDVLSWMDEHLAETTSVADLAARAAMSPRSFARHFAASTGSTPYQWLLTRRVQHAQRLLETSELTVDAIAERSGLGNGATLRTQFRRQVGTSPDAYRRAFGCAGRAGRAG